MVHQNTKKSLTKKILNTVLEMYKERQYSHKIRIVPYTFQLLLKNMPKIFVNSRNSIFFQSIDKMFKNFSLIIGAELAQDAHRIEARNPFKIFRSSFCVEFSPFEFFNKVTRKFLFHKLSGKSLKLSTTGTSKNKDPSRL